MLKCERISSRALRVVLTVFFIVVLLCSLETVHGSVYHNLTAKALTTVTSPPVRLQSGTAGSSVIYTNDTSAMVSTVAPASTPTYYPNSYTVPTGTYLSGSVPASVETEDTDYFTVRGSGTATSNTVYNPSGYNLLGSTTLVSGSTSNLTSNDNSSYMTFRSYRSEYIKYATTSGAVGFLNPANVQGSPDNVGASRQGGTDNDYVYGGGFATQTGNIGQVIIRMRYYVSAPSTSDNVRLSYRVSGNLGATTSGWFLPTATAWTNVDVDVTPDRSWTWTDIANTRVYCDYQKVGSVDSWTIYVDVLHVIVYSSYISEVEFTGTSNTYEWAQLAWTIDSAWTTGSVTVTLQLYNYQLGQYPPSGNGYLSYTSNSIPNTDETQTQTVTTNPANFRNSTTGDWKIKVTGEKITTTQFDFKADWVEFKPTYYSQYTASTEFLFASMTKNTPTQLNFTVVSEYDIASVSVSIQVWNYSSPGYVTSGEGCLNYTSSGSNETKLLNINTNPQVYTSNGNAKIKVTGVLTTTTQFQQKVNQVKLVYSYSSSPNYNYVLKVVNQANDPWKIRLKTYSQSNIGRLTNCTIYFRNSSDGTLRQIYVENGVYVNQTGSWYDLLGSLGVERYIAVTLQANNSEVSYVYVYLEILVPNKTTYAQYVITFEIT